MKKKILLFTALAAMLVTATTSLAQTKVRNSMIITTDWLAKHLNDDGLVLLQVGDKKEFDAAHIKGAQYIQTSDISTPRGSGLILELPPVH